MFLFGNCIDTIDPLQIIGNINTKEHEAVNHFHILAFDWGTYSTMLHEVNNKLLRLAHIEGEVVVLTPCYLISFLHSHHCS